MLYFESGRTEVFHRRQLQFLLTAGKHRGEETHHLQHHLGCVAGLAVFHPAGTESTPSTSQYESRSYMSPASLPRKVSPRLGCCVCGAR